MSFLNGEKLFLDGSYDLAVAEFLNGGCPKCLYYLGLCYLNGFGVDRDATKASQYFSDCFLGIAEQAYNGDVVSQLLLGNYYYNEDISGKCDFNMAVVWYEASAQNGNSTAMFNLANCLFDGTGVDADSKRAAELYAEAAAQGNVQAIYNLAVYLEGATASGDISDAIALYFKAANLGCERSMYAIGQFYVIGRGLEKNRAKGVEWLKKAAQKEFYPALTMLSALDVDCTDEAYRHVIERPKDYVEKKPPEKKRGLH